MGVFFITNNMKKKTPIYNYLMHPILRDYVRLSHEEVERLSTRLTKTGEKIHTDLIGQKFVQRFYAAATER